MKKTKKRKIIKEKIKKNRIIHSFLKLDFYLD